MSISCAKARSRKKQGGATRTALFGRKILFHFLPTASFSSISPISAAALAAQLKDHSLARTYVCIVCGKIKDDSGTIDAPIGRHPADRKKMAVTEKNSRSAVTHWRVLERFSGYTLVECKLETGRTHQIRVHMAYRGHPILGDMVYGHKKPELGQDSQCLHAKELRFVHPRTGQLVTVSCELPDYFTALLEKLRARA